jgi:hypothetical protein
LATFEIATKRRRVKQGTPYSEHKKYHLKTLKINVSKCQYHFKPLPNGDFQRFASKLLFSSAYFL